MDRRDGLHEGSAQVVEATLALSDHLRPELEEQGLARFLVAAATQNQAMNALVCLSKRALNHALPARLNAIRASKKINVPVVITREEVAAVLARMDGTAPLVAKLLYGSGLRIMEAVRLRVKDIAERAGITPSSVLYYYPRLDELMTKWLPSPEMLRPAPK